MPILVSCPHCACAAKASEVVCPHCGGALRSADGSISRTAVAVLLGLSGFAAGCESAPKYGAPATADNPPTTTSSAPTAGTSAAVPTATATASATAPPINAPAPEYGVPVTR